MMRPAAKSLVWAGRLLVAGVAIVPVAVAVASPLQFSRDAIWIVGGMAGVVALALLFIQPVLIGGLLPSMRAVEERRWHRWIGGAVVALVVLHVLGLYVTSPEDITDALLLVSPTPFAVYGVIGLAGVILTGCIAAVRTRVPLEVWRIVHTILAVVIVAGSVGHALLIEGVMGDLSKLVLCIFVVAATAVAVVKTAFKTNRLAVRKVERRNVESS